MVSEHAPRRPAAPYGAWPSPITTADVVRFATPPAFPVTLGGQTWWTEPRPTEGGRTTIMHRDADGVCRELLPAPWDARTRVHEYGGRPYTIVPGHGVAFTHNADQRIYLLPPDGEPRPLTPEPDRPAALRYADLVARDDRIWCVREWHHDGTVRRGIVSVPLDGGEVHLHVSEAGFFAFPTLSPDGRHLAYICWNHPHMPWNGTELRITRLSDGRSRTVAGGPEESVLAPQWRDDHSLYAISDRSGWWNLYLFDADHGTARALYPAEEEFAFPLWQLGGLPYRVLDDGRLAVLHGRQDMRLGILDPKAGTLSDPDLPYAGWGAGLAAEGDSVTGVAYGTTTPATVVRFDTRTGRAEPLRRPTAEPFDAAYLPRPRTVEIDGVLGRRVHAVLYPPSNPEVPPETAGAAPYVVFVHGGPTSHSTTAFDPHKAYFTSRGIGVLDVNYSGSTGYGRAYRERLRGQWGIVDVEDVVAAAEWLAKEGLADPARIAIRGASAGGWTVMAACCVSRVFAGGVSYFGVSALAPLVAATHDFESRYIDWLVGPEELYRSREPLAKVDGVTCPMLLLQGLEDPVVPPAQSEAFATALSERGVPCTYLTFEREAHGFRRAEARSAALAAELAFYQQIFLTD